mmetsp:Transcript_13822/g.39809  ORF Transcript_13822/g.39809 Transcript_13822/m.39809 type:complete len:219 (+) Transcript_13822:122-778(+)
MATSCRSHGLRRILRQPSPGRCLRFYTTSCPSVGSLESIKWLEASCCYRKRMYAIVKESEIEIYIHAFETFAICFGRRIAPIVTLPGCIGSPVWCATTIDEILHTHIHCSEHGNFGPRFCEILYMRPLAPCQWILELSRSRMDMAKCFVCGGSSIDFVHGSKLLCVDGLSSIAPGHFQHNESDEDVVGGVVLLSDLGTAAVGDASCRPVPPASVGACH